MSAHLPATSEPVTSARPSARAPLSVAARSQSCAGIGESVGNRPRAVSAAVRISASMSRSLLQAAASVPSATFTLCALERRRRAFAAARASSPIAAQWTTLAPTRLSCSTSPSSSSRSVHGCKQRRQQSEPLQPAQHLLAVEAAERALLDQPGRHGQLQLVGRAAHAQERFVAARIQVRRQGGRDQRIVAILVVQGDPLRQAFVGGAGPRARRVRDGQADAGADLRRRGCLRRRLPGTGACRRSRSCRW